MEIALRKHSITLHAMRQKLANKFDTAWLTYTLFVVQSPFGYRQNMKRADQIGKSKSRWQSTTGAIVLFVFGVFMVVGSLPNAVRSVSAAPLVSILTPSASTIVETDRSAVDHPCKRGAVPDSIGTCVASGFSAGLAATGIERAMPVVAISQLGPEPYTSLVHQWRGFPPYRPPRS